MMRTKRVIGTVVFLLMMMTTVCFATTAKELNAEWEWRGGPSLYNLEKKPYTGPPVTLRFSHFAPPTHMLSKLVMKPWLEMLKKDTDGKIKIDLYLSGVLHGARDGFKAATSDITDLTPAYVNYQKGSFHLMHVMDLPFAFPSSKVACLVGEELAPKYFKKEYEKMGVYLANINANGTYNLITKKPVRTLKDLRGLKVRSSGGLASEIIKLLGAIPVHVTAPEAYTAFQRGIVDAALFYNAGIVSYRLHELGKYLTIVNVNIPANAWAWNKAFFDKLPQSLKSQLYMSQRQLSAMFGQGFDFADMRALEMMKKKGIQVIHLSPNELSTWKGAVEPIWQQFIKKNEALGLPAKDLVRDLKALSEKYSSWTPQQVMEHVTKNPVRGMIDGM